MGVKKIELDVKLEWDAETWQHRRGYVTTTDIRHAIMENLPFLRKCGVTYTKACAKRMRFRKGVKK